MAKLKNKKNKGKKPYTSGSQSRAFRGAVRMGGGTTAPRLAQVRWDADKEFDRILEHPTVKLAVEVVLAMLLRQPWQIDVEDDDIGAFQFDQIEPYRKAYIRSAFRGYLKDGWRAFETRFGFVRDEQLGLRQSLDGIKPLDSDRTDVLVSEDSGAIIGLENRSTKNQTTVINRSHMLLTNNDDDGFGALGQPLLRSVQVGHRRWENCDKGAQRYDEKVAGGFLFIKYPVGKTNYSENGGARTDNAEIADALGRSYKAAGWGAVPVNVDEDDDGSLLFTEAWKAEVVAAAGGLQPGFAVRLKYCDALMLRAFGLPERSATEGTFGTKAEAEAHADVAILVNGARHDRFIDGFNEYVMRPWNLANFGDPEISRVVRGELDPNSRELFATIFTALMADPLMGHDVSQRVDISNLLEKLQIPVKDEATMEEEEVTLVPPVPGTQPVPGQPPAPKPPTPSAE